MTKEELIKEWEIVEQQRKDYVPDSDPDEWRRINKRRIELINKGLPTEYWFRGQGDKMTTVVYDVNVNGEQC